MCNNCGELEKYLTSDTESGFPSSLDSLSVISHENYRNESLRQCPQCGTIFAYRQWTPGGSEDAMVTYVHESLLKYDSFGTLLWFSDSISEAENLGRQGYEWLTKLAGELAQDDQKFRKGSGLNPRDVINQGEKFLERKNYLQVHEVYRVAALKQYERAQEIVKQYRKK